MALGGSKERSTVDGCTVAEAVEPIEDDLARLAPQAVERRVTVLLEPLEPRLSNVIKWVSLSLSFVLPG